MWYLQVYPDGPCVTTRLSKFQILKSLVLRVINLLPSHWSPVRATASTLRKRSPHECGAHTSAVRSQDVPKDFQVGSILLPLLYSFSGKGKRVKDRRGITPTIPNHCELVEWWQSDDQSALLSSETPGLHVWHSLREQSLRRKRVTTACGPQLIKSDQ